VIVDGSRHRVIEFTIRAPVTERPAPLIVISHGAGGHYSDHVWLVNAFLRAGWVVAALNHPHDTRKDGSPTGLIRVWDRPADVSFLLSHLLKDPEWRKRIDAQKVAVAGFSSGGYTAIALAGGIFDPVLMDRYCMSDNAGPDCQLSRGVAVDRADATLPFRDDRVKVAIAMAPAVGPGVTEDSLRGIEIPVLLIAAADDELVRPDLGAMRYARLIRTARLIVLPKGGHFVFLECGPVTALVDLFIDYNLCGRGIDANRAEVQRRVGEAAITFAGRALSTTDEAT
jgi:predicted dienelactone hydrolase